MHTLYASSRKITEERSQRDIQTAKAKKSEDENNLI